MTLPQTVTAGQTGHVTHHDEIHQLLAAKPWSNVAAFPSLQAAHDSLPAAGGGLLIPPNYTVMVSGAVKITKPVAILGFGRSSVIQARGQGRWDLLEVSGVDQFSIARVMLDGGYPDRQNGSLISFTDCSNALVDQCRLVNAPHAVVISRCQRIWIERNYMFNLGMAGVRMDNPGANKANSHIWIMRNHIEKYQQNGVAGNAAVQSDGEHRSGQIQERFFILHNQIIGAVPGGVGIGLDWATDSLVEGNTIIGAGHGALGEGIAFTGSRNRIIANRTKNTGAAGILLWATVRGGNADNEIAHNICTSAANQGIALVWGESNAVISNLGVHHNRCFDEGRGTQHWGVQSYVADGVTGYSWNGVDIHDNNLRGNLEGPYNLLLETMAMRRNNIDGEFFYHSTASDPASNASQIRLGSYTLWVDPAGRLRIKDGVPTSQTDGTVVGTQA
jgi:Right handed beta helix region